MLSKLSIVVLDESGGVLPIRMINTTEGIIGEDHDVIHQFLQLQLHALTRRQRAQDDRFVEELGHLEDDFFLELSLTSHSPSSGLGDQEA